MGKLEPGSTQLRKAIHFFVGTILFATTSSQAAHWSTDEITNSTHSNNTMFNMLKSAAGWHNTGSELNLQNLVQAAESILPEGMTDFNAHKASGDDFSTTLRFAQSYKGVAVVGSEAMVHFDKSGKVRDVSGTTLSVAVNTEPKLSIQDARLILIDRYQQNVKLSEPAKLKILSNFNHQTRLVYHLLTRTTPTHAGKEIYLDAQNGQVIVEFNRAHHAAMFSAYSADTPDARAKTDGGGDPIGIDMKWYAKAIVNDERFDARDVSAVNAYRNSKLVYEYFKTKFGRRSYDDKDGAIVSVVHIGLKWNNAFWTDEFKIMGYGDGDGEILTDLTYGLDVAAHELTHGVTSHTADLVYAAESGALNESYSDFFGRMVNYSEGNWLIGEHIVGSKWTGKALRNMLHPEEEGQPGSNDSPMKVPTKGPCTWQNDACGVHTNSGIPNRAAALITQSIGNIKTEKLYYNVLTRRLTANSNFADARRETEKECAVLFGGADSSDCKAVKKAFDTVKM